MDDALTRAIATSLAEWGVPHVELAIFGKADAAHIAALLHELCLATLHSPPEKALFYRSSVGAVAGLTLRNGRRVVVKAHQPSTPIAQLKEVVRLRSIVASTLGLSPPVLAGPLPFALGAAIVEEHDDRGIIRNGHEPAVRRALAASLHALVDCLSPQYEASTLPGSALLDVERKALWPTPHSKLFDFTATMRGAEYIDELAAMARARMAPVGRHVIAHGDWRAEHVRFDRDVPVVAFDWDSLQKAREPALVGAAAHMFCADWSKDGHVQAPTLHEAREFVADYEAARSSSFTRNERALCAASFVFSVAYTSRCGHAAGVDARDVPGSFHYLLAGEGERLFAL